MFASLSIAIGDEDAIGRPRGRRLAAIADLRIDHGLFAGRAVRDRRRANRHAAPRARAAGLAAAGAAISRPSSQIEPERPCRDASKNDTNPYSPAALS